METEGTKGVIARERGIVHKVWGPGTDHLNLGSTQKSIYLAELGDTPPLIAGLETAPPRATPYQTLFPSIPGKWPRLPSSSSNGHLQTRTKADLGAFLPRAGLESALCSSGSFSLSSLRSDLGSGSAVSAEVPTIPPPPPPSSYSTPPITQRSHHPE